jgi:uncharacterized membrane protein YkvA (DUF1232 family)
MAKKKRISKKTSKSEKKSVTSKTKTPKITQEQAKQELNKNKKSAEEYASDKKKTAHLLDEAPKKSGRHKGVLAKCWDDLTTLIRLVRAYIDGKYRSVPCETIIWAIAAIIYFVNPFDLIPDFIPGIGYLDDAVVVALVVASIRNDIEHFRDWEEGGCAVCH